MDLTTPWNYGYLAFLIPVPDNVANISAVVKPFQWPVYTFQQKTKYHHTATTDMCLKLLQVWLSVVVSIPCVIFTLNQLQRFRGKFFSSKKDPKSVEKISVDLQKKRNDGRIVSTKMDSSIYLYVFGNLLSQGFSNSSVHF